MIPKNYILLTTNICSCKIMDIPPVGVNELEQIIRYKLSSYYPGNINDLKVDFIKSGNKAIVFFIRLEKLKVIYSENPKCKIITTYHLFKNIRDKNGIYVISLDGRLEVLEYEENELKEVRSIIDMEENRIKLEAEEAVFIAENECSVKNVNSLFLKRKKRNYLLQNIILLTLIIVIPQIGFYFQVRKDEQYLLKLKTAITEISQKREEMSSSVEEMNNLELEYANLMIKKPMDIYEFISDLSFALGSEVKIESLVLKENSFQMNGRGLDPLVKMERFQDNKLFDSVIPYQVQAIEGSSLERFSLSGEYDNE